MKKLKKNKERKKSCYELILLLLFFFYLKDNVKECRRQSQCLMICLNARRPPYIFQDINFVKGLACTTCQWIEAPIRLKPRLQ